MLEPKLGKAADGPTPRSAGKPPYSGKPDRLGHSLAFGSLSAEGEGHREGSLSSQAR
jgi:hypothetical protein